MRADYIIKSDLIYTGTGSSTISGAVAVAGNRIIFVGPDEEAMKLKDDSTEVIEACGRLVMPGFIDSHCHYPMGAIDCAGCVDLEGIHSAEDCLAAAKKYYDEHPDISLLYGWGWHLTDWEESGMPSISQLDAISADIPICLCSGDGWLTFVNSKALADFGYTKDNVTKEMEKHVWKDENGELSGILYEDNNHTCFLLFDQEEETAKKMILDSFDHHLAYGITTLGDCANESGKPVREPVGYKWLRDMEKEGRLKMRVYVYPIIGTDGDLTIQKKLREEYSDGKVQLKGLKIYFDGVIDGSTALLTEPYSDDPGSCGEPYMPPEQLHMLINRANAEDFAVRCHCVGDGAVRLALECFEESNRINGKKGLRNCIEHMELVCKEDYRRFVDADVIAASQPVFVYIDTIALKNKVGDRWNRMQPVKTMMDAGVKLSMSTDYPIVDNNPFLNIYTAMTRLNNEGELVGSMEDAIDIYEGLHAYTYMSAYTMGVEDQIGSLKEGMLADIIIVDGPVVTEPVEKLLERKIVMTMVDGEVVHSMG